MSNKDSDSSGVPLMVSSLSDLSIKARMREVGLSTDRAMEQFAQVVRSAVLNSAKRTCFGPSLLDRQTLLFECLILVVSIMIVYHDASAYVSRHEVLVRVSLLFVVGLGDLYCTAFPEKLRKHVYLTSRIQKLLAKTQRDRTTRGFAYGLPPRIPLLPKHKFVRVYRDGKLQVCPATMLVAGDVIQLLEGEPEPCRLKRVSSSNNAECIVLESPIVKLLEGSIDSLNHRASLGVPLNPRQFRTFCNISIVLYMIAYLSGRVTHFFDLLTVLICFRLDVYPTILQTWTCVRIQIAADALKKSKSPYHEATDADEFDEDAPPPSKDIAIRPTDLLSRIVKYSNWKDLFYQSDLVELLGTMSVLCFADRDGPISLPLSSCDELVHVVSEDRVGSVSLDNWDWSGFEWKSSIEKGLLHMKPFGLSTISCSRCNYGSFQGTINPLHRRFFSVEDYRSYISSVALQTCQCAIGRAMGIESIHSNRLELIGEYWLSDATHPRSPVIVFAYTDRECPKMLRCFAVGPLSVVLGHCAEYYVDGSIVDLSLGIKKSLLENEEGSCGRDEECVGFAFQTLLVDSFSDPEAILDCLCVGLCNRTEVTCELEQSFNELCFLGSTTCSVKPREDMQEFIDDVMNAGIRFVYLGDLGERQAKTFGSRLGLETDWNGCILLSPSDKKSNYSDPSDFKTRLPVGVSEIREHLKYVDDIPLHVSVFAESSPKTAAEMVRIYQENNESVCMVISSLNPEYHEAATQADFCISMEPLSGSSSLGRRLWEVAAEWNALASSMSLPFESSPYILTDLIKEARTLRRARRSSVSYFRSAAAFVLILLRRIDCIVAILCFSASIYGLSFHDSDVLKLMPEKNERSGLDLYSLGFLSSWIILTLLVHYDSSLMLPCLILLAAGYLHPVRSLLPLLCHDYFPRFRVLTIGVFCLLLVPVAIQPRYVLCAIPLLSHETVKYFYRCQFIESQKRSKLEFSTRLGMHSPI